MLKFLTTISSWYYIITNPKQRKFLMEKLSELSDLVCKERIGIILGEYDSVYGLSEACSEVSEQIEYLYMDCVKYGLKDRIELLMDYHLESHFEWYISSSDYDDLMWGYFGKSVVTYTSHVVIYRDGDNIKAYGRKLEE